jgi:GNAT superfamily N-acetyltransferase
MSQPQLDSIANDDSIRIRGLEPSDFDAVVAIDAKNIGRRREAFFQLKLADNLSAGGIRVSLGAELDGIFVGFLLARVFYGEFGITEPAAALDTLGVHPDFQGQGVGAALVAQLKRNLVALRVRSIQTEVSWDDPHLLTFFQHEGFRPAPRFALDLALEPG